MKLKLFIVYCLLFIFVLPVFAVDSTPSAKAQDLLDRVATKVAELSAKLQKSYTGKIKSLGSTSIAISTDHSITTNDATTFFRIRSRNKTEINFSALKMGDDIAAIGTIDPTSLDLSARQIIAKIHRENMTGKITAVNKTVVTIDDTQKIDLDGATLKQASLSGTITPAKLANFTTGSTIFAIAVSPDEKTGIFSVLKALVIN